jgi:hypothetical protein
MIGIWAIVPHRVVCHIGGGGRLQSWALFAEISGAESLGEIGAGA